MKDLPLEDEFEQTVDAFIVNLSIEDFWDAFLDEDAPFFITMNWEKYWDIEEDAGDLNYITDWFEPYEEEFKTSVGKPVIL